MNPSSLFNHIDLIFRLNHSLSLLDSQGQVIFCKAQRAEDFGNLVAVGQNVNQYLKLLPSEVAVVNDPYSGGSHLSCFYLVCRFQSGAQKQQMNYFTLVKKILFKPRLRLAAHIDEEGVRVPPTPIGTFKEPNLLVIKAIAAHPLAPAKFESIILNEIEQLCKDAHLVGQLLRDHLRESPQAFLKDYSQIFRQGVNTLFDRVPDGIAEIQWPLGPSSSLQLKLNAQPKSLTFDFSGTGSMDEFGITDSACLGVCIASFLRWMGHPLVTTQALYDRIILIAPKGSFVNQSFPQPIFRGITDGVAYLSFCLASTFEKLRQPGIAAAFSGYSQCSFELDFGDQVFFDHVLPGSGGQSQGPGEVGAANWGLYQLQPSVEEIEAIYPMRFKTINIRKNSGGSGVHPGGAGQDKTIELLRDARFTWSFSHLHPKLRGSDGGRHGAPPEVVITLPGTKKQSQPLSGTLQLPVGSVISVHSSGGGGWGFQDTAGN